MFSSLYVVFFASQKLVSQFFNSFDDNDSNREKFEDILRLIQENIQRYIMIENDRIRFEFGLYGNIKTESVYFSVEYFFPYFFLCYGNKNTVLENTEFSVN